MSPAEDETPLLVFDLARFRCALFMKDVREVLPMAELLPVPGAPPIVEGILNLAGTAVPVIRLDRLFGFPSSSLRLYTPMVVLRGQPPVAIVVDRVSQVFRAPLSSVVPVREGHSFNNCAHGELTIGGHQTTLLSAERILLAEERSRLTDLRVAAEERLRQLV